MSEAAVEREMIFNGGDERAAKAIVLENDSMRGLKEITARIEVAQKEHPDAA